MSVLYGQTVVGRRDLELGNTYFTNFCQTFLSGTPPPMSLSKFFKPTKTKTECTANTKNTYPPCTAPNSAISEIRADSSKNLKIVFAAVSERCGLCAFQYEGQVRLGGFS